MTGEDSQSRARGKLNPHTATGTSASVAAARRAPSSLESESRTAGSKFIAVIIVGIIFNIPTIRYTPNLKP